MEKIYRFYNVTKTTSSILEVIDIDIATGKVKGRDIYTGRRVTVKRSNVLDRAYLTEYEVSQRLKNASVRAEQISPGITTKLKGVKL